KSPPQALNKPLPAPSAPSL
uniref:Pro-rich toxin 4 n=1 Tax=Dendroaspis angusticeps TaxID=8618 RepID=TX22_DENAN|nr:RecName: Full=Pro-rich toxin 4; Contains: RecName: Full=Pro-rich toxin 1; Contains: RecName: Full=Pro-rich toxin 2; Contains: RecName: Full=Pro-rich toxin 3 [Dendroaspis angusticeps]